MKLSLNGLYQTKVIYCEPIFIIGFIIIFGLYYNSDYGACNFGN
jgi:hypothetical protein